MPYSRIVVTCGVSALGGANVLRKWAEDKGLLRFWPPSYNPEPPEGLDVPAALKAIQQKMANPRAFDGIVTDAKRVSAEYSALQALRNERRITERPTVVLIHTDSLGGNAVSMLLDKLISRDFDAVVECIACSINVNDRNQLRDNLGDFMQKVASALKDYDKHATCFAPLGGYKVMTSLGYLAGAYLGFPTLYTHEDNQLIHEIPAIPVRVPTETLQRLAPLMAKVGNGAELSTMSQQERDDVNEYSWLFEHAEGLVCVNAFGLFLMQDNPSLFGTKLMVSKDVDREFRSDGRRGFILQQLGVLAAKLTSGSAEGDLQHEREWNVEPFDDWHLYKGASNGQQVMRAIYRLDSSKNTLVVRHVWTSHDYVEEFETKWNSPLDETVEWQLP